MAQNQFPETGILRRIGPTANRALEDIRARTPMESRTLKRISTSSGFTYEIRPDIIASVAGQSGVGKFAARWA